MTEVTIGIDIGGTTTDFGFVDRWGRLHARGRIRTDAHDGIDAYLDALLPAVRAVREGEAAELDVKGVGLGAPNANYYTGTVDHAPNLSWEGVVPLAELVSNGLGLPAALTNDANAAALGEMLFGSAKGLSDFVLVTLGTGLGSGFVANGQLLYGHDGFAGELGHTIVEREGRVCGCGRRGCLETYVSVTGLKRTVLELLDEGRTSTLDRDALDGAAVHRAAETGDEVAREAFRRTGDVLGLALANAVAITSPEAIVLFGGLVAAGDWILEPTRRSFEDHLLNVYRGKVRLAVSGLAGSEAAVQGAAALAWTELEANS